MLAGILLFIFSCRRSPSVKISEETGSLLDNTQSDRLYVSWSSWQKAVSDSGTLSGHNLNFPDTISQYLNSEKSVFHWFKHWLKINGPERILQLKDSLVFHGLNADYYHLPYLAACHDKIKKGKWASENRIPYDSLSKMLLLSADAVLGLYHDLGQGRTLPVHSMATYILPKRNVPRNTNDLLQKDGLKMIDSVIPRWREYRLLGKEFARLHALPDSFADILFSPEKVVRKNDSLSKAEIILLNKKLRLNGYYTLNDEAIGKMNNYNEVFYNAISALQTNAEIEATGNIGPKTLSLLNQKRADMMNKLAAAMERWRWLGPLNKPNRVAINIAANRVEAYRNDSLKVYMATCSGEPRGAAYYKKLEDSKKPKSKVLPPDNLETPLFTASISHFVVNPTWFVPRNILVKEMLPEIRKNPAILKKMGYVVKDKNGEEINPWSIDWNHVTPNKVNFTIVQTTGDENSLGKVVIHFPNPYAIFMHDTPHKWVFGLDERHVSHGCIRLQEPFKMVEFLTSFNKKDNFDKALIAAGMPPEHDTALLRKWKKEQKEFKKDSFYQFKPEQDKYFRLDSSLPVYLVYFNAWSNSTGNIMYSKDSYKYDKRTLSEMNRPGRVRMRPAAAPKNSTKTSKSTG